NASFLRLMLYSENAFKQARKFAQPSVFPANHLIFFSFISLLPSVTFTKVLLSSCSISSIVTTVSGSQTKVIFLLGIHCPIVMGHFSSNSGNVQMSSAFSVILPVLLSIKY